MAGRRYHVTVKPKQTAYMSAQGRYPMLRQRVIMAESTADARVKARRAFPGGTVISASEVALCPWYGCRGPVPDPACPDCFGKGWVPLP